MVTIHGKKIIKVSSDTGTIHRTLNEAEKLELKNKIAEFRKLADKVRRDAHNVVDSSTINNGDLNNINNIVNIINIKNDI